MANNIFSKLKDLLQKLTRTTSKDLKQIPESFEINSQHHPDFKVPNLDDLSSKPANTFEIGPQHHPDFNVPTLDALSDKPANGFRAPTLDDLSDKPVNGFRAPNPDDLSDRSANTIKMSPNLHPDFRAPSPDDLSDRSANTIKMSPNLHPDFRAPSPDDLSRPANTFDKNQKLIDEIRGMSQEDYNKFKGEQDKEAKTFSDKTIQKNNYREDMNIDR